MIYTEQQHCEMRFLQDDFYYYYYHRDYIIIDLHHLDFYLMDI